jgi:hypothetical protein
LGRPREGRAVRSVQRKTRFLYNEECLLLCSPSGCRAAHLNCLFLLQVSTSWRLCLTARRELDKGCPVSNFLVGPTETRRHVCFWSAIVCRHATHQ